MDVQKFLTKEEFRIEVGLSVPTLNRWIQEGFKPAAYDDKGKALFSREQIAIAKARYKPNLNGHKNKAADASSPLFDEPAPNVDSHVGTNDTCAAAPIDSDSSADAPQNDKSTIGQPDTDFDSGTVADESSADNLVDTTETPDSLPTSKNLPSLTEPLKKENVDVEILPPENVTHSADVITLEERAARIRKLSADVARGIIEIGRELIAAKEQVGHGNWANWLRENFDWSDSQARYLMNIAKRFGNRDARHDLNYSALKAMLSLPEGDEEAFIKAQADKGRPIENQSSREIKAAVKDWKNQKTTPDADNKVDVAPNDNRGKISRIVVPDVDDDPDRDFDSESSSEGSGENESVTPAPMDDDNALTIEHEPPPTPEPIDGGDSSVITPDTAQIEESAKPLPPLANRRGGANYEWYTPPKYCNAVRQVLGAVDLDPTSCELANQNVGASKFFTVDDDTLNQDWVGRVFMNPPFSNPLIDSLVDKFVSEYSGGNITAGVVLTHNCTETDWFIKLASSSNAILFTDHRINFLDNGVETKGTAQRGQCFFYFGSEADKFLDVFKQFGWGVKSSFLQGLSFSR